MIAIDPPPQLILPVHYRFNRPAIIRQADKPPLEAAIPFGMFTPKGGSALHVLQGLGLTAGLKLVLDAGDLSSYTAGGTKWLDTSGNGYDFFRGADGTATTTDPTFNGSPGALSSTEYFSLDGGDYFTYDTSNETWMNNLHKDNAKFSWATWIYIPTYSTFGFNIFGNNGGSSGVNTGTHVSIEGQGTYKQQIRVSRQNISQINTAGTVSCNTNAWNFCCGSLDEATTNGLFFGVNGSYSVHASAYPSPNTTNATYAMQLGARGNANQPAEAGSRYAMLAIWESVALAQSSMTGIYNATRGRFGL